MSLRKSPTVENKNKNKNKNKIACGWQGLVLNLGAVLGSLCILMTAMTLIFGFKPLVFASGSMAPEIPTGSFGLAVPTPVSELDPGQVVSVVAADQMRVTHRILENTPLGLILKGDANPVADLQPYAVESADRLLFSVPNLGYVISWFGQPWAFFAGGLLCAYVFYLAFIRRGANDGDDLDDIDSRIRPSATGKPDDSRDRNSTLFTWTGLVVVLALAVSVGWAGRVESTTAAFGATAQGSAAVATDVMSAPAGTNCAQSTVGNTNTRNQTIDFTWSAPLSGSVAPTGYLVSVQVNNADGTPSNTNQITNIPLGASVRQQSLTTVGSSRILNTLLSLLGDLLGYDRTITVKISATYPSGWTSVPIVFNKVHATAGLLGTSKKLTCTLH